MTSLALTNHPWRTAMTTLILILAVALIVGLIDILAITHGVDSRDGFDGQVPGHRPW